MEILRDGKTNFAHAIGEAKQLIKEAPRGTAGFGYDPLMFIPEQGLTVAEMDAALKNTLSHRARAAAQLRGLLQAVWRL